MSQTNEHPQKIVLTWPDRYYWASGVLECLIIILLYVIIPADPKNQWIFGFSKTRVLLFSFLGLILTSHLFLFHRAVLGELRLLPVLFRWQAESRLLLIFFVVLFVFGLLGPSTYLFLDLKRYQEVVTRLIPILAFFLIRALQFVLLAGIIRVRKDWPASFPRIISRFLFVVFLNLLLANLWSYFLKVQLWNDFYFVIVQRYFVSFNFDFENNIPTLFSSINLALSGLIFFAIFQQRNQNNSDFAGSWRLFALVFLYLAVDEFFLLHERFSVLVAQYLNPSGVFGLFPWVVGFAPLVLLVGLTNLRFILSVPPKTRNLLMLSAFLFVTGAIIFELAGGVYTIVFGVNKFARFVLYTIEESLEMTSIILLIYTLLSYYFSEKSVHFKRAEKIMSQEVV
jgi:hypothetical protein